MSDEFAHWMYFTIAATNRISQKNTLQLFYITLLLEWKGLSHSELDVFSYVGGVMMVKQYHKMKES